MYSVRIYQFQVYPHLWQTPLLRTPPHPKGYSSTLFVNTILARQLMTCPQYVGLQVTECLNRHYPNCMIGSFDPQAWPARSPDLMPLDYVFLGPQCQQDVHK